ncbi:nucleoporin Nup35 isoform X2 [Bradysia coprophila]|uniref:nucleoporin Nup35 isoform X2 n=1 Tax=Bradysia coprophila TaxID=38358 RepID=UPI00187D85A9|nr:nucleoporin Nup35 isoform X2 [Bradysia coprophila]
MEPMTLSPLAGSPVNQPSHQMSGNINFLPAFLMGESTTPVTNPMSPNNARNLAFGQQQQQHHYQQQSHHPRDVTQSPNDLNRSILHQKSLFGFQSPPPSNVNNGPPTKGLFDALQEEKNFIEHSPFNHSQLNRSNRPATSASFNQSYQYNPNQSINDSYLNQSEFHTSHIMSPPQSYDFRHSMANSSNMISSRQSSFWITVFGFPQSATSMILSHFAQCGTIVEKVFAPQCGNWIHLKYSSRLECDKAINYNERIIGTGFMIGVVYCKDESIVDKENIEKNSLPVNRVRPLAHVAYKNAQTPTEVAASPTAPKKSSGIINNVMESIFGW